MPRLRARIAAWLVEPPSSVTIPAIGRSPRLIAWLGRISWATRITDSSPLRESPAGSTWPIVLRRQVRLDPQDHVADVGHPLAEVILLDPRELRGVAVHDDLQRRQRRQLLVLDQVVDLGQERGVVDDLQVALEDVGLGESPSSCGDLLDDRLELGRRLGHGAVEPLDLRRDLARDVEGLLLDRAEHRLHAMGHAHHDPRTDTDSLTHDEPVSRFRADRTEHALRRSHSGRHLIPPK